MNFKKEELASVVKSQRATYGLTQKALSDKTGISLRTIQRIERGEVEPHAHTVKILMTTLKFSGNDLNKKDSEAKTSGHDKKVKKIILGTGSPLLVILLATAYLSQSPNFPETTFELSLYWTGIIMMILGLQWKIWKE